ncbi:hypothetical protein CSZ94_22400 [Janthinobacterium sp. ROICE36]|uniref:non-ribosomal peptide synthetase n=1 Tax=Janthinobacterium sp. ROICE36 TaxID=2048670 RepID=UPI000C7EB75D|nr:non-ribosomal peptide synthetase [Janthinobacterium sp. ROICE36]PLY40172.1 hypothetical protein CSZ94_22400 [Janthinobacterium sp. ROICE36]
MSIQQVLSTLYQRGLTLDVDHDELLVSAGPEGIDADTLALVKQHKSELIALLHRLERCVAVPRAAFNHVPGYRAPATLAQQRMLFMEELAGDRSYYNMPAAFELHGPIDRTALRLAFCSLLASHDILRTTYLQEGGSHVQHVTALAQCDLEVLDLDGASAGDARLAAALADDAAYRFDLGREGPLRVRLIALEPERHVLSLNVHHICADGWSAQRILADLGAAYSAARVGMLPPCVPAEPGLQYADYAQWQAQWLGGSDYTKAADYWRDTLAGAPELHSLPTDFVRPQVLGVDGATIVRPLGAALSDALGRFGREAGTSAFVVFQSAYAALLARYSGETDIVFGTAAANRHPLAFLDTVGLFVNTVVLRLEVGDALGFAGLVRKAAALSEAAFRHQQFPFDALVDLLEPARSAGYGPLVQLMLVMQDRPTGPLLLDGVRVQELSQRQAVAKFDLALHVHPGTDGYALHWEYNTNLFEAATVDRMAADFSRLLAACMAAPEVAIGSLPLATPAVPLAPRTAAVAEVPVCVHQLVAEQAGRTPQHSAVRDVHGSLNYVELEQRASRVASGLLQRGVRVGQAVGVCMEKSCDLVVAMLAIYKSGAVYLPLDPHYPPERLGMMAGDANIALLVCGAGPLPNGLPDTLDIVALDTLVQAEELPLAQVATAAQAGAYVIYTSGSTGKPKGVLVTHANLFHSLRANAAAMAFRPGDVIPTIGSQAFGVSLLEMLLPLVSGGTVQIVSRSQVVDIQQLVAVTVDVTVLHAVPSLMRQWLETVAAQDQVRYRNLRLLLVGGESVPASLLAQLRRWRPALRVLALYGMTESTIVCASHDPDQLLNVNYAIGKPYAGIDFYVLNRHGQQQPPGVPGELHIGGVTVAAGYLNQPAMTAERFSAADVAGGARLYRTGDRVRLLASGDYEFLGRVDHQVSLRGARIELGEIETVATSVDGVLQAVAHVAELDSGEVTLVLYFTARAAGGDVLTTPIRARLAQRLPDYMRPSIIQRLDLFPLNPNGKVDRKRLPRPHVGSAREQPGTALEKRLAQMWGELLGLADLGVTDSFFELGGHSLMASKLTTRVRSEFGVGLPLTLLFSTPTIRACAAYLDAELAQRQATGLLAPALVDTSNLDELIL